jgi:hypothetical protein
MDAIISLNTTNHTYILMSIIAIILLFMGIKRCFSSIMDPNKGEISAFLDFIGSTICAVIAIVAFVAYSNNLDHILSAAQTAINDDEATVYINNVEMTDMSTVAYRVKIDKIDEVNHIIYLITD